MLLVTAFIAICIAAVISGSWFWARLLFTLVLILNLYAVLGAIFRRGAEQAFWLGFSVFGWACCAVSNLLFLGIAEHQLFAEEIVSWLNRTPDSDNSTILFRQTHNIAIIAYERIVHSIFGLLLSILGGGLAAWTSRSEMQQNSANENAE